MLLTLNLRNSYLQKNHIRLKKNHFSLKMVLSLFKIKDKLLCFPQKT